MGDTLAWSPVFRLGDDAFSLSDSDTYIDSTSNSETSSLAARPVPLFAASVTHALFSAQDGALAAETGLNLFAIDAIVSEQAHM
jgi:hypothetical protein